MDGGKAWKSYAKVNVFLKVVGVREDYHELSSRFVRVQNLFDEISVLWKPEREFRHLIGQISDVDVLKKIMVLEGKFGCELEENTMFKAVLKVFEFLEEYERTELKMKIFEFLAKNKIVVKKNIPIGAGLAGGSSNAGVFLNVLNEVLELGLEISDLMKIGMKVGADVNFFVAGVDAANVRGIGERIDVLDEEPLNLEIRTPEVFCSTKKVFQNFRENFWDENNVDLDFVLSLESMSSREILLQYEIDQLNDLFSAVLNLYPELESFVESEWFLTGSGSSFFRIGS